VLILKSHGVFASHRQANLRVLEVTEIKTVPYGPHIVLDHDRPGGEATRFPTLIITSIERMPGAKGSRRRRAMPIAHEQISVGIDGSRIVEAYTKRQLLYDFVIRHPQVKIEGNLALLFPNPSLGPQKV
jgi:hypothetical protein